MNNSIEKWNNFWVEIWRIKSFKLALKILKSISKAKEWITFSESRMIARKEAIKFYQEIFPQLWINVNIKFSDVANDNFPLQCEALNEYILNWNVNSEYISKLFLWNHTKWSIEAVWAYSILPPDTRILLKDLLTYIPWITSLDPIVFYRNKVNPSFTKKRNKEIYDTLEKSQRVLIYPEWTRIEWNILWEFNYNLYSKAFESIKTFTDDFSKIVTLITTDSFEVMPNSLEKSLLFLWKYSSWNINITIDFIDAWLYDNIKEFNNDIKSIIQNNIK